MLLIFQTDASYAFTVLRVGLAVTFFAHSLEQIFGWFDGRGYKAVLETWNQRLKIPMPLCILGMLTEFAGSFALLFGFLVRPVALGLAIFMAIAMIKVHWRHGFFLGRVPGQGNGIEFCLALCLMAVALVIGGAGALAVDLLLSR